MDIKKPSENLHRPSVEPSVEYEQMRSQLKQTEHTLSDIQNQLQKQIYLNESLNQKMANSEKTLLETRE